MTDENKNGMLSDDELDLAAGGTDDNVQNFDYYYCFNCQQWNPPEECEDGLRCPLCKGKGITPVLVNID